MNNDLGKKGEERENFPKHIRSRITIRSSNPQQNRKQGGTPTDTCIVIFIATSRAIAKKVRVTRVPTDAWMDKQNVNVNKGKSFGLKKGNPDICRDMDGP